MSDNTKFPPSTKRFLNDWNISTNPTSHYSEKTQQLFDLFTQAKNCYKYLYVLIDDFNKLTSQILPSRFSAQDVQNQMNIIKPLHGYCVIAVMDLAKSFDEQIRVSGIDPGQLISWEALRAHPIGEQPQKLIEHQKPAGYIVHFNKLSVVWKHPKPETLPPKKYIGFCPRNHLSLVSN